MTTSAGVVRVSAPKFIALSAGGGAIYGGLGAAVAGASDGAPVLKGALASAALAGTVGAIFAALTNMRGADENGAVDGPPRGVYFP